MHSEKIPYYILDLLQQVPSVFVKGLGRFDAIFHPAVIDLQQAQIKPPFIQPDFKAMLESEEDLLASYIHYVSGIDIDEANETITSFVNDVHQRLEGGEPFSIEKFGIFSKSASDILHFTPDWDAFNLAFSGLEVIDLKPRQEFIPPEKYIQPQTPIPDVFRQSFKEETTGSTKHIPDTHPPHEETSANVEVEHVPANITGVSESTSRLAWIILTSALMLITILCAFLAWDIFSGRKKINQYAQLYPDTLGITNEFDIPVIMDTLKDIRDSVSLPKQEEVSDASKPTIAEKETEKPCYIIVGAFTNADNVSRMAERLKGLGYTSAEIKGGTLTRVAISTSCDKANLQKILSEARSGINPESWIY